MKTLGVFGCGLLFGLGLAISGMADPAVVLGFLDLGAIASGQWNPALAGVMIGAVPVTFLLYRLAGTKVPPPTRQLDRRLIVGSILFGLGWGLAGICPGPGLAAWILDPRALLFVGPMLLGMGLVRRLFPASQG